MKHTGCLHFITLMNLLHLPTSVNCPQDIISHIQVVHRLQVKSMHSLIRVWFLNPFRLPSSQCEAYSQHLYKCQCCFVVDCILQILFSSYPISLSFNQSLVPGVHIGDGAIIGANSVVGSDVPPYTKVVGNPARAIQKRFDDELIELLLRFKWWDRSIDEINRLIPILTCSDLDKVKAEIKKQLG